MTAPGQATRKRIVEAAIETLKAEGFAGTSARAVAKTGGFNQALVFYHFGSMSELLLAALDETGARRMSRYREALADVDDLGRLAELAGRIFQEDLDAGHMTVLPRTRAERQGSRSSTTPIPPSRPCPASGWRTCSCFRSGAAPASARRC